MLISASSVFTAVVSLAVIIGVIWFTGFLLRHFGFSRRLPAPRQKSRQKTGKADALRSLFKSNPEKFHDKIGLIDTLSLSARRKLCLISCQEKVFLLVIGGNNDLCVEVSSPNPVSKAASVKEEPPSFETELTDTVAQHLSFQRFFTARYSRKSPSRRIFSSNRVTEEKR